ncbi:calpastatin [Mucilaginibacter pedocola]|uniref:Calpastatin n=2 Tax=Mucilaginibacter pedocola TaxID=1792845 RepID=A0A1S9PMV8_9SPHI|nr:calpastatin [Mucilaginibacter pedocola]
MDPLKRFKDAQARDHEAALDEISKGRKRGHWMWYIFPQIAGLGQSEMSARYAIKDMREATAFLLDEELSLPLVNICKALLVLPGNDSKAIFGSPDDLKLRSSMTLFDAVPATFPVFGQVLDKFFSSERDKLTLKLLGK